MSAAPAPSPRTVVCGIDFSPLSRSALDLSVEIARRTHGTVHAVHADESAIAPLADIGLAPGDDPVLRARLQRDLERDLAPRRGGGVTLVAHVDAGPAAAVLGRAARELGADLVVLGTHGRTGLSHLFLGSVAERVAHESPVSVLTVPHTERTRWPFRTIVCATDFSDGARSALRASLSVLPSPEPQLHLVHVVEEASFLEQFHAEAARTLVEDLRRAVEEEVEAYAPAAAATMRHVRRGIPYDEILAEAQRADADLIVLGASGHSGTERALVGSVTARVVRGAPIPVLIVRPTRASGAHA